MNIDLHKCERCDTLSSEVPLVETSVDNDRFLVSVICGKCYEVGIYGTYTGTPVRLSHRHFFGEDPPWYKYKKLNARLSQAE